jgi:hypothetical protein
MDEADRVIALTPEQLTEVCVRFAMFMGWTEGPGSDEWKAEIRRCGSAGQWPRVFPS